MDGLFEEVRPDLLSLQGKAKKNKHITKQFILDQLSDNEIDLSMSELTTVPVRELAMVPRGTRLDLSRNFLRALPENFGSLRHLIGLDLSNNRLQCLPDSFGQLALLQRLDLYSNQLRTLPLTFFNLKKLKWLDLKNNPLEPGLKEAAGSCVSSKECNQCASKVMAYLRLVLSQADKNKKRLIEKQRARERKIREEEAEKRLILKQEKIRRKRLRALEFARQGEGGEEELEVDGEEEDTITEGSEYSDSTVSDVERRRCPSVGSVCSTVLLVAVVMMLVVIGGNMLCNYVLEPTKCQEIRLAFIMQIAHFLELLGFKID